ncbi:MAG: hypothetical protein WBP64_15680 [Nitrososphaeraceae archaeon]
MISAILVAGGIFTAIGRPSISICGCSATGFFRRQASVRITILLVEGRTVISYLAYNCIPPSKRRQA